jgi:hypothetical protein
MVVRNLSQPSNVFASHTTFRCIVNIFYLDHDPVLAARYQVDKHVVKMILETAQLLCTAHHVHNTATDWMYKPTHRNHPSAIWCRETGGNYMWLWLHGMSLCDEYTLRYKKTHATTYIMRRLALPPKPLCTSLNDRTPVRLAMPDEYKVDCPVQSYRNYYQHGKRELHQWTRRPKPTWIAT